MLTPLEQYLKTHAKSSNQFADDIKTVVGEAVSLTAISFWRSGRRWPDRAQRALIQLATNGAVTSDDWFEWRKTNHETVH